MDDRYRKLNGVRLPDNYQHQRRVEWLKSLSGKRF